MGARASRFCRVRGRDGAEPLGRHSDQRHRVEVVAHAVARILPLVDPASHLTTANGEGGGGGGGSQARCRTAGQEPSDVCVPRGGESRQRRRLQRQGHALPAAHLVLVDDDSHTALGFLPLAVAQLKGDDGRLLIHDLHFLLLFLFSARQQAAVAHLKPATNERAPKKHVSGGQDSREGEGAAGNNTSEWRLVHDQFKGIWQGCVCGGGGGGGGGGGVTGEAGHHLVLEARDTANKTFTVCEGGFGLLNADRRSFTAGHAGVDN